MIESHRAEGCKIPQIYKSLPPEFRERIAFGTFRNTYYQMRKESTGIKEGTLSASPQTGGDKGEPKVSTKKIGTGQTIEEHQAIARAAFGRK